MHWFWAVQRIALAVADAQAHVGCVLTRGLATSFAHTLVGKRKQ
jgi:hypothetical protein